MMYCRTNKLFITLNNYNILHNLSLDIEMGKTTAIIGKNGSGKTTLLKCINCLLSPTSGKIYHKFSKSFPMLFQKPFIFENTVQYNFEILSKIKKIKPLMKWYKEFELDRISKISAQDLSGGEKQKLFLARVLSIDSEVIIMDEPNINLDLDSEQQLIKLIIEEKENNKTIICALHDYEIVEKIADKIILLNQGKIAFIGNTKEFFNRH